MKKIIFFLLILPLLLAAQISFGLTAGTNTGKFGGVEPPNASYSSLTGINIGAVFVYRINDDFSLTVQPTFSQRGSTIEVGQDTFFDSLRVYKTKINFITLPFFVRIDSDNGLTYFISGLEFGIPLSSKIEYEDESWDISNSLNNVDILASIGMGFRFSIGSPDLLIEFRYYQGLTNFNSSDKKQGSQTIFENFKNSGFQLMAGLEWEL